MVTLHNDRNTDEHKNRDEHMRIAGVRFDTSRIYVTLEDEREIAIPLWWHPRLYHATPGQRERWEFCAARRGLHWPELDEDLDAYGFIHGLKTPGAQPPAMQ